MQVEVRRNHRQVIEAPLAALDLVLFGRGDLEQVTYRRRDDRIVGFEIAVVLRETAERLGDVVGDGRLLRDDQLLAGRMLGARRRAPGLRLRCCCALRDGHEGSRVTGGCRERPRMISARIPAAQASIRDEAVVRQAQDRRW